MLDAARQKAQRRLTAINVSQVPMDIFGMFDGRAMPERETGFDSSFEGQRVADALCGVPRDAVTARLLHLEMESDCSVCIHFLSKDAFLYYLPAFISLVVEDFERLDLLPFTLVWYFTQHIDEGYGEDANPLSLAVLAELTPREADGLRWFADYMRTHHQEEFLDGSLDRLDQVLETCPSEKAPAAGMGARNS